MHTVLIAIALALQSFPVGTQAAGIQVTLSGFSPLFATEDPDNPGIQNVTFDNVPSGDYVVTAQAVDMNGIPLGDAVTQNVTVNADAVQVSVPTGITITVTPQA